MKLSIVVAFYNEEKMIEKTHGEISKQLQLMQPDTIDEYELVYINDGSKDKTLSLMKQMAQNDHRVRFISFSRNFGREGAILSGLKYATGDAVMLMDGDLQHPPALIPSFVTAFKEGYDVVSGQRDRKGEPKPVSYTHLTLPTILRV